MPDPVRHLRRRRQHRLGNGRNRPPHLRLRRSNTAHLVADHRTRSLPNADRLLICADDGGSDGLRVRAWEMNTGSSAKSPRAASSIPTSTPPALPTPQPTSNHSPLNDTNSTKNGTTPSTRAALRNKPVLPRRGSVASTPQIRQTCGAVALRVDVGQHHESLRSDSSAAKKRAQ